MSQTSRRVPAKKVLEGAKKFAGKDVIVVATDRGGDLYLASSMPSGHSLHFEAQIKLLNAALKKMRQYHRNQKRAEQIAARG